MPIAKFKDVRPRFARLGKLRKGAEKGSNKPGADLEYFRFDGERPEVQEAFEAAYGPAPASLSIYLVHPTVDENFSTWQELWAGGGLVHRCDGEVLHDYREEDGKLRHDEQPTVPCPYATGDERRTAKAPGCKPIGRLEVMLPELLKRGHVGTVTFETHSLHDIGNILGVLKATADARGADPQGLRGIEFSLYRQPEEISMPGPEGKPVRRTKWLCKVAPAANWVQMQLSLASAQAMGGEVNESLALPAPDAGVEDAPAEVAPPLPPPDTKKQEAPAEKGKKGGAKRKEPDPGPPPPRQQAAAPATAGRQLGTRITAFGQPLKTAGVTTATYAEIMTLSKQADKILGKDGTIRELEHLFSGAFIIFEGKQKYTRCALTEPEGQAFVAKLRTIVAKVQRAGGDGDPGPSDDDFSDSRE